MARVCVGIGSNIRAEENMAAAAALLRAKWPQVIFSSVYRTRPVGYEAQEDFLNAVACFGTTDTPEQIRKSLNHMEQSLGKATPFTNGPRTIDLDVLLYDEQVMTVTALTIPHPRMHERRFVLEPLCELVPPNEKHPVLGQSWESLLEASLDQSCDLTEQML